MDVLLILKWCTAFATPLGLACLLILLGLLLARRWIVGLALVWLWFWSTPWAANQLAATLEHRQPLLAADQLPAADAIVLLGGALGPSVPNWLPQANLSLAADRLVFARQLYAAGKAPYILYSGGSLSGERPVEAEDGARLLQEWGVPAQALVVETHSRTTRENALYSLPLLRERGARRVLLLTSAWHLPRALVNFRAAAQREGLDIEFIPAACDPVEISEGRFPGMAWLPNTDALNVSRMLFKEYLGLLHARLFGG